LLKQKINERKSEGRPTGKVDACPEHPAYVGVSLVKSLLRNGLKKKEANKILQFLENNQVARN
jgi:hypothetical protein